MQQSGQSFNAQPIPATAGMGLRAEHYQDVVNTHPPVGWLEVHSENYFGEGGIPHYFLEKIRCDYPISFHGVGLSLGSVDPLNLNHIAKLKTIINKYQPGLVSEHVSFSSVDGRFFNDLLPLPYTEEALTLLCDRVSQTQDILQRQILMENPSTYVEFVHSSQHETEFLQLLAQHTGCGLLLDINNVYVCSQNHGFSALDYFQNFPFEHVGEVHLAGHTVKTFEDGQILIDTHDHLVCDDVWKLLDAVAPQLGNTPLLIEWDTDLPELSLLTEEANRANQIVSKYHARAA